ncbi:hypothetical protein [Streptomyces buecherae]|uniref:hypothetical protein n=1 Tax=Streptomyces buecherae TaxID=2763006 RepID=UPI0036672DF2
MTALLSGQTSTTSTLRAVERLAAKYRVPVEDALLIAVNLHGIDSDLPRHRARVQVRLLSAPSVPWQLIVPLNVTDSPFRLTGERLTLGGAPVGTVERIDADEAVGGYFRDGGAALTLNPNGEAVVWGAPSARTPLKLPLTLGSRRSGTCGSSSPLCGSSTRAAT